jgi:sugar lactone lactonase YvrE
LVLASLLVSTQPVIAQSNSTAYTFTTLAGYPGLGSADGAGSAAQFNGPTSVAVDSQGNVFVADYRNHTIRMITPAGVASTIAGFAGTPGSADGNGNAARFFNPYGVVVDNSGNLYVTEFYNLTVRKLVPMGTNWVVSTIAGVAGFGGIADGTNNNARFGNLTGIAIDRTGNLYVADMFNNTIRKLMLMGGNWVVTTIVGSPTNAPGSFDGTNRTTRFYYPQGLVLDSATNLYVADTGNSTIRKIVLSGTNWVATTIAGLPGSAGNVNGTNSAARFNSPYGLAVDSGTNLYVADYNNSIIRKVSPLSNNWVVGTLAGSSFVSGSADGTATNAQFRNPAGVATDNAGNVYVADLQNSTIRKITSAAVVSTIAGSSQSNGSADGTGGAARFYGPCGLATDATGNIYVADRYNHTIRKLSSAGVVSTIAGFAGSGGSSDGAGNTARFNQPYGVAVHPSGDVYVSDNGNHTIRKITPAGLVTTIAGMAASSGSMDGTNSAARFYFPYGVAVDMATNLFVVDQFNSTIRKITPVGTNWVVRTIAGLAGTSGYADGSNSAARFNVPFGIAVDAASNIYVEDTGNNTIRKIAPEGTNWVVTTIAGLAGNNGYADGIGVNARFTYNASYSSFGYGGGITVDGAGNLYVADYYNNMVRKIMPVGNDWVVSTIGGFYSFGSSDGTGSEARFQLPNGIAVDNAGAVYVGDTGNNTIRKGFFTQYGAARPVAYSPPPMNGRLTVTLQPPEANGQWRFPWEFGWHGSGYTVSNLVAGNYQIEFRNVPGYLALPISPVQVTAGGMTVITNEYYPTINSGAFDNAPGSLTVLLGPTPPSGAGWRFLGDSSPFFPNLVTTNLPPGTYIIEFAPVSGRVKPPSQMVQINPGLPFVLSVNYLLAASPPANVYLPFPVPANQMANLSQYPFGFNGQLQSDTGYGSGMAVQTNVVLTAAHLIFNDQTLSYVSRAHWFFRRDAGVSEPLPQAARGWYVLSGYAAQRTNDLQNGYSPDQSTAPSRNVDVAALYFLQPVAGGGHGGYLPSDAVPNTWLASTALKMLVGYPVDGSQFGDASIVPGRMYQTDPQPYPLNLATDPVPGQQQVYVAPWLLSYPGNSGGPMYVQLNGYYYPAAVYLGTLFSGSQPYGSVVRAIDSNVVNMITLAAAQGDSGTNNTGGGVVVWTAGSGTGFNPGLFRVNFSPTNLIAQGAGWRVKDGPDPNWISNSSLYYPLAPGPIIIEFRPVIGYNTPSNLTVNVTANQTTIINVSYVAAPSLFSVPSQSSDGSLHLALQGASGKVYAIQTSSNLVNWTDLLFLTNSSGTNFFTNTPTIGVDKEFFRARQLP